MPRGFGFLDHLGSLVARHFFVPREFHRIIRASAGQAVEARGVAEHLGQRHDRFDGLGVTLGRDGEMRPRRPFKSPITAPTNSSGQFTSTCIKGSSRIGWAASIAFLNPIDDAILKASSDESTT